jgi:hypothetical protein
LFGLLSNCAPVGEPQSRAEESVIVGTDDRLEPFQVSPDIQTEALSTAALIFANHVRWRDDGDVELAAVTAGVELDLCDDEPFRAQPAAAFCSGVLIDDSLIATAGHCLGADPSSVCSQMFVAFDYAYTTPSGELRLKTENVFACRRVLLSETGDHDYAIIELDRNVGRVPASLGASEPVSGDKLVAISSPMGVPLKCDTGAIVGEAPPSSSFFYATTDTFGGSSGGPLFDADGGLVGIVARGEPDFWMDQVCKRSQKRDASHEQHQRSAEIIQALCATGYPSLRLCGRAGVCGDGICAADEVEQCEVDCKATACGDSVCALDERTACTKDCSAYRDVPASWSLPPSEYATEVPAPRQEPNGCAFGHFPSGKGAGFLFAHFALVATLRRRFRAARAHDLARSC